MDGKLFTCLDNTTERAFELLIHKNKRKCDGGGRGMGEAHTFIGMYQCTLLSKPCVKEVKEI